MAGMSSVVTKSQASLQKKPAGLTVCVADLSAPIAAGLALRYTDKDVQPNSEYRYYIYSGFKDPNIRLDTARIRILSDRLDYPASAPRRRQRAESG